MQAARVVGANKLMAEDIMASISGIESENSAPRASRSPKWGLTLFIILLVVLCSAAFAWNAGVWHKPIKIAIVTSTEDVYWDRLFLGGEAAGKYFDAQVKTVRCKTDEKAQSQTIRDLLASGIDGLIVSPVNPEAQIALLNEVSAKIPLITVDSDSPSAKRIAFIGTNNYEAGRQAAELLTDALPDGGEVIVCVGSIDNDNGKSRREGLIDALMERPRDATRAADPVDAPIKAGKFTVLATLIDGADPAKAVSMAADAIKQHPNLKGMVGLWSYNVPSLLEAAKQTGKTSQIKIIGFDDLEHTLAGVTSGSVFGTLVQDQYNMGFDSVMMMCATVNRSDAADSRPRKATLTCTALLNAEDVNNFRLDKEQAPTK